MKLCSSIWAQAALPGPSVWDLSAISLVLEFAQSGFKVACSSGIVSCRVSKLQAGTDGRYTCRYRSCRGLDLCIMPLALGLKI